jgi:predicted component of type VI protein secretion system
MTTNKQFVQHSVFDRLDSSTEMGVLNSHVSDMQIVKKSVLRDVENLLNTRRVIIEPSADFSYVC